MTELTCDIEGCEHEYSEDAFQPYGWCQCCEEFSICEKRDDEHEMSLLYNEGCSAHDNGGYSICIPCALKAFKEKNPDAVEERCICPVCEHDFGLLEDCQFKGNE